MLQVFIEHYKNETIAIKKIAVGDILLAELQDNNTIDLDVCVPYINQRIKIHHEHIDSGTESYTITAILEAVEIDPATQFKCIKYSVIE